MDLGWYSCLPKTLEPEHERIIHFEDGERGCFNHTSGIFYASEVKASACAYVDR
jgi:hypothetical protein